MVPLSSCSNRYTESAFQNEMLPTSVPEIQRTNLGMTCLTLKVRANVTIKSDRNVLRPYVETDTRCLSLALACVWVSKPTKLYLKGDSYILLVAPKSLWKLTSDSYLTFAYRRWASTTCWASTSWTRRRPRRWCPPWSSSTIWAPWTRRCANSHCFQLRLPASVSNLTVAQCTTVVSYVQLCHSINPCPCYVCTRRSVQHMQPISLIAAPAISTLSLMGKQRQKDVRRALLCMCRAYW